MVEMCRGVPLAILTMAKLVRSRELITESEIYQLKDEFMQEMQLRYFNELPSWHLKQYFAYSSFIFSTEPFIDSERLIRLWMAEGFLGPINCSAREPEDFGRECIQEFHSRSIFLNYFLSDMYGSFNRWPMDDKLMRDLSAFVAASDNFCMDDPDNDVKERVRRMLLSSDLDVSNGIPKSLFENNKNLRTILILRHSRIPYEVNFSWSACDAIFCGFNRLRVLILQNLGMKMLPISIGELKTSRYLDLSHNNMKKLPNSIVKLKHLQTLILSHCHELKELPSEINDLASLRHLEMEACLHLTHMPSALKKLTSLRTLSHFVVSTSNEDSQTGGLWQLINLNNLRGELEILHLERLKFKESDQGHAYLKKKEHLEFLTLRWNDDDEDHGVHDRHRIREHSPEDDQISLRQLEPHPNLQGLSIVGYEGNKFSDWLSSLKNLVKFSLYNCSECKKLPPLDQLPKLEIIQLQRLESLEFIMDDRDNELGVVDPQPFFPLLKDLKIRDCPNLTGWWKGRTYKSTRFHSISKLQVQGCPKLDCMPLYPDLDELLILECCSIKPLLETLNYRATTSRTASDSDSDCSPPLSKLKLLKIANVEVQYPLQEGLLKNFPSLHSLVFMECKGLKYPMEGLKRLSSLVMLNFGYLTEVDLPSDEWEGLKNVTNLTIVEMPKLESLPEGIEHLTSLHHLKIDSCPELTTLTEGIGHLKSLKSLEIEECHKLASLPQGLSKLTSLNKLRIRNCPLLLPRCQKETGDDWPHIKHIKYISVKDASEYYG